MGKVRIWTSVVVAGLLMASGLFAQQVAPGNTAAAVGSVPRLVKFSGTLAGRQGEALGGVASRLNFSIYEDQSGGAALWSEIQDVRLDAQGRYSVLLGAASSDGLPAELFSTGGARWLGVQVEGRQEDARVLLVAVPYALKAADADTLGGKPATAFVATEQLKDQVQSVVNAQVAQSASTTRTLVGTAPTPQAIGEGKSSFLCNVTTDCVTVTQSGSGVGLHATTPAGTSVLGELSGTTGAAVYGRALATTGAPSAVQGDAAAPNAVGVLGRAFGTTGTSKGVFGRSFSTSGTGVHGDATPTTGATRGVWGTTASNAGVGVYGQSSAATGFTTGVSGTAASTSGVAVYGLAGATSGSTIGVQAKVLSPGGIALVADNVAGSGKIISAQNNGAEKFSVLTNGNVTAGAGTFSSGDSHVLSATSTSGNGSGSLATNVDGNGVGVYGNSTYGVFGTTGLGSFYSGVHGVNPQTGSFGDLGSGLFGGTGAYVSGLAYGVHATGPNGVYGESSSASGNGVWGKNLSHTGVYGDGGDAGVWGHSVSGDGVYGYSDSTHGVFGQSGYIGVLGNGSSYGVYGMSNGTGVYGVGPTYGIGVQGMTASGYGVYGEGDNGVRGVGVAATSSTGVAGIGGSTGSGVYGQGGGYGVFSDGTLGASGSKPAVLALPDNRVVEVYAMESPDVWFEDFGTSSLSNGVAEVALDPTFALTVNTDLSYHVFLTANGECEGLYVARKTPHGFQIREVHGGKSDISFDYRIVAKRRGFESVRLQEVDADAEAIASVRAHNHARSARPVLRIPKKLAVPQAPSGQAKVEARGPSPEAQPR